MPRTPGYATRQRSLVLECLKAHAGQYLSVADIAADLTKKGSPVGVTTIYRALEKLASAGTVRRFVPDRTSPAVFEYLENPAQAEFHVRCKGCGKLFHLHCSEIARMAEALSAHLSGEHGVALDLQDTVIQGLCSDCLTKTQKPAHSTGQCACGHHH